MVENETEEAKNQRGRNMSATQFLRSTQWGVAVALLIVLTLVGGLFVPPRDIIGQLCVFTVGALLTLTACQIMYIVEENELKSFRVAHPTETGHPDC